MSTPDYIYPIIILSDFDVEDAFSSTNTPDYILASPNYFPVFEIGESSHKTYLERHEEQIETILNHLDELPLMRIEHMEDKIKGLGNGQDFYSKDDYRGYPGSPPIRYEESSGQDPNCIEDCKVKFAIGTLTEEALSWWNSFAQVILAVLCPTTVPNSKKLMEVFIRGLPRCIEGNATASKPQTLEEAITITQRLMDQVTKHNSVQGTNYHKRKFDGADKNFVSISLASMLNIPPITLDTTYDIEMANGNLVGTNTVIQSCTLILLNQPFEIDLMPIKLGSFDIVIGMDWLSKYHARIIFDEKVVHIPIDGETLII
ncbi:reverse transcriptase domain-containing protein [Tanacetum coccineum]